MRYFTPEEFRGQYDLLDEELKTVIDEFRHLWGDAVTVSPAPGSIGREYGRGFHNYAKHGTIKAIDLMPSNFNDHIDFKRAYEIAKQAGARGIGIYPDWRPSAGIHLDVGRRPGRVKGYVAKWSGFRQLDGTQKFFSINKAFKERNVNN